MKENSTHWTEGGTGVTNFNSLDEPQYLKAIELYGDPDIFIIHAPFIGRGTDKDYSLHDAKKLIKGSRCLSAFWNVFDGVCKEMPTEMQKFLKRLEN